MDRPATPYASPPPRTPVLFDPATGRLRIGPYERRVSDPGEPTAIYSAYLSLLYTVRGAQPGERLALRRADLEALLLLVGDDPATLEARLVGLMGCTPEQASALGRLLLGHRRMTASLGIVAGLALGGAGVLSATSERPATSASALPSDRATLEAVRPVRADPRPTAVPVPVAGTVVEAPAVAAPAPDPVAALPPPTTPVVLAAPRPAVQPPAAEPPALQVDVQPVEEPAPVEEQAYALPTYAEPVMDAPPPVVEEELPASDIGIPAVLDLEDVPLEPVASLPDPSTGPVELPVPVQGTSDLLPDVVEPAPAEPATEQPVTESVAEDVGGEDAVAPAAAAQ